jgi:toxin CcdB
VLVLQHDQFDDLKSRLVAPLVLSERIVPAPRLHPLFEIEGCKVYLNPTDIAGLPTELLLNPITNVAASRDAIIAALDLVFTGI